MKKKSGLLLSSTSFFIASIISFGAKFTTSVIVARSLGVESKGSYVLVLTAATLLIMIFNVGINSSITYFTASQKFNPSAIFGFAIVSALGLSAVGGLAFWFFYRYLFANTLLQGLTNEQFWLMMGFLPINLLIYLMMSLLLGHQQFLAYNLMDITRAGANLILQAGASLLALGLPGALGAWVLSGVITFFLLLWLLLKDTKPSFAGLKPLLRPSLSYGLKSYIANLNSFFNYRLDTFLVNFYLGQASLGQYSTGVSVAEFLWYLPRAISSALFPKVSSLSEKTAHSLTAQASRITLAVMIPLALGFSVIASFLIPVVFGEAFRPSVPAFLWLMPGVVALTLSKVISANLSGIGKPQYATYISSITVLATIILDILLIPKIGIVGAAIASSIAYTLNSFLAVVWFVKESHLPWHQVVVPALADWKLISSRIMHFTARVTSKFKRPYPEN